MEALLSAFSEQPLHRGTTSTAATEDSCLSENNDISYPAPSASKVHREAPTECDKPSGCHNKRHVDSKARKESKSKLKRKKLRKI